MKCGKTYGSMMRRSIKGTLSRFLAILCIVALGTGFLCGLMSTEPDMKAGADQYFDEQNMMDFLIQSTVGLSKKDIKVLREQPYVEQVEGKHVMDMMMQDTNAETYVTRVIGEDFSDKESISRTQLLEGRMPEKPGECVVEVPNMYAYDVPVGQTLVIDPLNTDYETLKEDLSEDTFEVVGIVRTPQFIHMQGDTSTVGDGKMVMAMYVPDEVFTINYFTAAYLIADGTRDLATYSDDYRDRLEEIEESLTPLGKERAAIRSANLKKKAQKEYNKALKEYRAEKKKAYAELEKARKKIKDGRKQLDDGRQAIVDGKKQIEDGKEKLTEGRSELEDGKLKVAEGKDDLKDAKKELEENKQKLSEGWEQLEEAEAALNEQDAALKKTEAELAKASAGIEQLRAAQKSGATLTEAQKQQIAAYDAGVEAAKEGRSQINATKAQLSSKRSELQASQKELDAGEKELQDKEKELSDAEKELTDKQKELDDGKKELEEKEKQLEKSDKKLDEKTIELEDASVALRDAEAELEQKLADGKKELKDAKKKISRIEKGKWIIRDRYDNMGVSGYDDDSAKIGAISKIFPVFFFIIAALVALTTLTRLVEEERGRIGTLKSLGYTNGAILRYYMLYGFAASALGCLIGIPFGCIFFPRVISNAYTMMYVLPHIDTPVLPQIALPVSLGLTAMILLATWLSCREMLKEKPAALLLPKAPKNGKRILLERIGILWRALPFSRKVTLRNLFRYKKRFLMTIIGVAGCFALLLAGFGIRDSVGNIVDLQYGEIMHYDFTVQIDDPKDVKQDDDLSAVLSNANMTAGWCRVCEAPVTVSANGVEEDSTFMIPQDTSTFSRYVTLRERRTHKSIPLYKDSLVLTEKSAENLGVEKGDTVTLTAEDGTTMEAVLTGITENYVGSYVYLYPDVYKKTFDKKPDYTTVFVRAASAGNHSDIASALLKSDNVLYLVDTKAVRENFADSVKSIDYIVLVLIFASGALAIIVLYNLTNVNICERKKELATIRVLGFYRREVAAYVFREVDILAILGILVGIPVGVWLHHFIVITVEVNNVMFGRSIHILSYLIAAGLTILFTMLVNLIMRRPIRKIDMVESMKAVD